MVTKMIKIVMALGIGMLLTQDASARSPRGPKKGWVPQEAWNAIKARAGQDMGTNQVKLYKSRWSKKMSKGLQGNLGSRTNAYVVHAKSTGRSFSYEKKKGPYLAVKSNQGNWEVFPLALAANKQGRPAKGKHVTKADGMKENNTYAYADGWLGGTKVVQAVKAKNTLWTSTREGQIVASKSKGRTKTMYVLGDPNRQDRDPAAYAKVKLFNFLLPRRPGPVPMPGPGIPRPVPMANGERGVNQPPATIMPPHPRLGGELNTKFIEMPKPLHGQGQPQPRPQS